MNNKSSFTESEHYGICTNSTGACTRSYLHARDIKDGFSLWLSGALVDGTEALDVPRNLSLERACRAFFQIQPIPKGYCDSCGTALGFASVPSIPPQLGICLECRQAYAEEDIGRNFHKPCGAPVVIEDEVKQRLAAYQAIAEILAILPQLKECGYLKP
jgi:hypothetical protein